MRRKRKKRNKKVIKNMKNCRKKFMIPEKLIRHLILSKKDERKCSKSVLS